MESGQILVLVCSSAKHQTLCCTAPTNLVPALPVAVSSKNSCDNSSDFIIVQRCGMWTWIPVFATGQAGPGRRKIGLGRPRPLFRWPMKPMGPIGLTGVIYSKNKANFGCVWPPGHYNGPRPNPMRISDFSTNACISLCDEPDFFCFIFRSSL